MSAVTLKKVRAETRGAEAHLASIDVLRGLAALGVTLFHARVAWWVGWREIQANPDSYSLFDRAV
ncbi:MAG TPA: hypothetical protein VGE76_20695, partial [Opitutaceae bacterium]